MVCDCGSWSGAIGRLWSVIGALGRCDWKAMDCNCVSSVWCHLKATFSGYCSSC